MIKKLLIANRGEIAVRIIRTCREMGIRAVAVYSDADRTAMHVQLADEAYRLGGNAPSESYLRQDRILEIAQQSKSDAVHPGYGFLSENPIFAARVAESGLIFVGPAAKAIRDLGDKTAARGIAKDLGIPTVPGTPESIVDEMVAQKASRDIGYPILLKAAAGGGGKGMRVVRSTDDFVPAFRTAQSEAKNAFGDDRVYIEKYIDSPRHVEIQILADRFGHVVFLGERECSIQRRHQKLMEESPSPVVDDELRLKMGEAAVRLIKHAGYSNAATVEFLVDKQRQFYFLEVNTRLQVEHPVTELLTSVDLVKEQILIASGLPLSFSQSDIQRNGHAIECRICAEDAEDNFLPSTGRLVRYEPPQGPRVRVDTGLRKGDEISIFYDPLMAKVISWGNVRSDAIQGMIRALKEFGIVGVKSTIPFCLFVLQNEQFRKGTFSTNFIETQFNSNLLHDFGSEEEIAAVAASVLFRTGSNGPAVISSERVPRQQSLWKRQRSET
jgi:acetyl-CoA carboxylase biotin carboxylase subunit